MEAQGQSLNINRPPCAGRKKAMTNKVNEFDARTLSALNEFGIHVLQDLVDTMKDMINCKTKELAHALKTGRVDEGFLRGSQEVLEMKRVILEAGVLQGDIAGCLESWQAKAVKS